MITSALALQQLLTVASSSSNPDSQFLLVLANHIGLHSQDGLGQVASILSKKVAAVQADISLLPIDDAKKAHLNKIVTPFTLFLTLNNIHLSIKNAKDNFLKAENLVGLMTVHFALTGHIVHNVPDRTSAETLAESFRTLAEAVQNEDLPESVKRAFLKRIWKMSSILDHYSAFGPDELQDELDGLVGALVINRKVGLTAFKIFKSIAAATVSGYVLLQGVDSSLQAATSIENQIHALLERATEPE
jgi:hypothetical protein